MFCRNCGNEVNENAAVCLKCGAAIQDIKKRPKSKSGRKSRFTAALLAFLFGEIGAHKFYYGSWGWGVVHLITAFFILTFFFAADDFVKQQRIEDANGCFTLSVLIYLIVITFNIVDIIRYLAMGQKKFDKKYNHTPSSPFKW